MLLPSHGVVDFRSRPRKHGMELDLVGCERCFFLKKMHKDTVRKKKKKHASAYRSQKRYLQGNDANLHNICKYR